MKTGEAESSLRAVPSNSKIKSDFWKHYEHPEWQKKRLKILERDGYKCTCCDETEKQLHIHHAYYIKGRKPWEYPDWSLTTECKECHKSSHEVREIGDGESPLTEWEQVIENFSGGRLEPFTFGNYWYASCEIAFAINRGVPLKDIANAIEKLVQQMNPA